MNRREWLRMGTAAIGAAALSRAALGQAAPAAGQEGPEGEGPGEAAAAPPRRTPTGSFALDVYSRDLQWLRTPQEVAKAVTDIGLHSIDLTVMPYPGHVNPANVKTELPAFVKALKQHGVTVSAITCQITDADSPNAEAIIATAGSLGIPGYSWGGFAYDESQPYRAQLDALKPRVAKLARLNEKHAIKALYQARPASTDVGAVFFDMLDVLRNFDPRFVAIRYDTSLNPMPHALRAELELGDKHIGAVAINDAVLKLELPQWDDGAFTGDPKSVEGQGAGGDNTGRNGGNPLALGGGGRPLPYHFHSVPVGTGMVNLTALGETLKKIGFSGPAECQTDWPMGGAEDGKDKITVSKQRVLGEIKHNRLMVEAAFAKSWDLDVALPPYLGGAPLVRGGPGPYWPQ